MTRVVATALFNSRLQRALSRLTVALLGAMALAGVGCAEPFPPAPPLVLSDSAGSVAWTRVDLGEGSTCGLAGDGTAYCWGFRIPTVCDDRGCGVDAVPTKVATSLRFASLSAGNARACAATSAGDLYCWGQTYFSATLGDGVTNSSSIPVRAITSRPVSTVSVGYEHSCILDDQGTASCWGSGYGAIGDGVGGTSYHTVKTPTLVATTLKFTSISAGGGHTCAVLSVLTTIPHLFLKSIPHRRRRASVGELGL